MFSSLDHSTAAMDTDVKSSAWFDYPQPGYYSNPALSYFPAFQGTPFVLKKTEAFPGLLTSNVQKVNDITTNDVDHRTPSSTPSPNRVASTPLYKLYLRELMNEAIRWKGSMKAKFRLEVTSDYVKRQGNLVSVPVIIQNTSAMNEYANQSFEEIRFEDYVAFSMQNCGEDTVKSLMDPNIAKKPERESSPPLKQIEILSQPPLLNPLLLNTTQKQNPPSQETVSESTGAPIFDDSTTSLLQALMNNVKQSVDVNYLSEEAKRNCATLLHALADFTEKTLENLTVIVLEDMLRNIKQRKIVNSPAKADKGTTTNACAEPNSTQAENDVEKTHEPITTYAKKQQSRKSTTNEYEYDCSSDCQDLPVEKDERSVGNQPESVRELIDGKYTNTNRRRNTPSVSAIFAKATSSIPRSSRHSHNGSGRSTEKVNRHKGLHRKYSDEKYSNFREKTAYDDSEHEEFSKCNDDLKRTGKRDDTRAKHNRESFRRRKKNSKKVQFVITDECRICEGLGRVSINDCERKEAIAVKDLTPYCEEHVYETSEVLTEKENERRRPDRILGTTAVNSTESTVTKDEYESQSYSDSSSI